MLAPFGPDFKKAAWVSAARKDVNAFVSYCFLDRRPQHKFHAEWQAAIQHNKMVVLFAPLEHGKTEQISCWRSIWELGNNPDLRFWVLTSTADLASKIVTSIQEIILTNELVQEVFPNLRPEDRPRRKQAWNTKSLIVRRSLNTRDPSMQATGIMGTAIGSRVDRLIGDDVMNFKNTFFPEQRKRTVEWFQSAECMGRITADGRCALVNTPWHEEAVAHVAVRNMGFKQVGPYQACDDNFNNLLWPMEKSCGRIVGFDRARLEDKQRQMGTMEFGRCFLGKEITSKTRYFSMDSMANCIDKRLRQNDPLPDNMIPICGIDPATGKRGSADTAFCLGGVDIQTGMKQVQWMKAGSMGAVDTLKEIVRIMRLHPMCIFVVESNAQQDFLIQILNTKEIMAALGADAREISRLHNLVRPFYTGTSKNDLLNGIPSMGADFEAGLWRIPDCHESGVLFRDALEYRPGYRTGDLLMATYFFFSQANQLSTRRATVSPSLREFMNRKIPTREFSFDQDSDRTGNVFGGLREMKF
jgi:hypothetical protein